MTTMTVAVVHTVIEVSYSSSSSPSSPYPKPYQNYYYNEYHEGLLRHSENLLRWPVEPASK